MNFATLDLLDVGKSDFNYIIHIKPDGHQNIEINPNELPIGPKSNHLITIRTRIRNFSDLEILICSVRCLRNVGFKFIELYCPYILGSSYDNVNDLGTTRYFKEVIGPILNSLNFTSVISLEDNSKVLNNFLQNFEKIDIDGFLSFGLSQIYFDGSQTVKDNAIVITTDQYYCEKIFNSTINFELDTIKITSKEFNSTDRKTNIIKLDVNDFNQKDAIIISDVCRTGKDFIELSKLLNSKNVGNKYLIVTHGIFSDGFTDLDLHFNKIICTNSFSDIDYTFYISKEKTSTLPIKDLSDLIVQFNVF